MTAASEVLSPETVRLRLAWRRLCPGITDAEIDAMAAIGMRGTPAQVALRAYRAGQARTAAGRCSIDPDRGCPTDGACPDCMVNTVRTGRTS